MIRSGAVETQEDIPQAQDIRTIIARRADLSTFVVHLTRDGDAESAKSRLKSIVKSRTIEARTPYGSARDREIDSQKCVCFTETPLEYLHLLVGKIEGRDYDFAPYGVAITKKLGRKQGVNPVWYVDITAGHDWLMKAINKLIDRRNGTFDKSPISKITPFIEQMGTGKNATKYSPYRKEFWWEREWRHVGDFTLPEHVLLICPEDDFSAFETLAKESDHPTKCIDPDWGLEQIIARLAGFEKDDVEIL